jgi:hypothetical protein
MEVPRAKVVSTGAGTVNVTSPSCFHGEGDERVEYNHPLCVAAFDGDSELTAGFAGKSNCHVGLDFGIPMFDLQRYASILNITFGKLRTTSMQNFK